MIAPRSDRVVLVAVTQGEVVGVAKTHLLVSQLVCHHENFRGWNVFNDIDVDVSDSPTVMLRS